MFLRRKNFVNGTENKTTIIIRKLEMFCKSILFFKEEKGMQNNSPKSSNTTETIKSSVSVIVRSDVIVDFF